MTNHHNCGRVGAAWQTSPSQCQPQQTGHSGDTHSAQETDRSTAPYATVFTACRNRAGIKWFQDGTAREGSVVMSPGMMEKQGASSQGLPHSNLPGEL